MTVRRPYSYSNPRCRPVCETCPATRREFLPDPTVAELFEQLVPRVEQAVRYDRLVRFTDRTEVVQDVLIELFRQLRQKTPSGTLLGGLSRIVRAVSAERYRRSDRLVRNQGEPMSEVLDTLARCDSSPGEREVDYRDHVRALLSRLPKRLEIVARAVWIEGRSQKEVAAALQIKAPSVTRLLNRAREFLAPLLYPESAKGFEHRAD